MIGGLSVAQGNRNRTSAKNILAWDSVGNKPGGSKKSADFNTSLLPAAASAAVTNIGEIDRGTAPSPNLVKSLSQNDLLLAGSPSLRPERPKLRTFGIYTNGTSGGSGYRSSGGSPVVVPPFGVDGPSSSKSSSPSSFYNRGRTPSGTLFKSDSFNSCSNSNSNSPMSSPNGKSPPNGHSVGVSARNWL